MSPFKVVLHYGTLPLLSFTITSTPSLTAFPLPLSAFWVDGRIYFLEYFDIKLLNVMERGSAHLNIIFLVIEAGSCYIVNEKIESNSISQSHFTRGRKRNVLGRYIYRKSHIHTAPRSCLQYEYSFTPMSSVPWKGFCPLSVFFLHLKD